ncbi:EboA domain-containing protein [Pontibacter beigongshangensis]|uniref:EboA domain-containing protein n=1 Tax=Pontibacter beigongshangensis TaxID=2574733 RepID=UPI00164FDB7D|nr:EboA domain-containing protein [Pontibacter beigongshangensis]
MYQSELNASKQFLTQLIQRSTTPQGLQWLRQKLTQVSDPTATEKDFYLAFGTAPRFVGKEKLALTAADLQEATELRAGFNPTNWTAGQAARALLLLSLPHADGEAYHQKLKKLFETADMGEQTALYAALPLLPHPQLFKARASEGVRSNIGLVFDAVALDNPYPAGYLEEDAWNQLVLKTIFVGKSIARIIGIDRRSNPHLAQMLTDYAHERWAAGRTVTPELWRPVAPFINETTFTDIKKLFSQPDEIQHEAAALACAHSPFAPAKELLLQHPDLKTRIEQNELNWTYLGAKTQTPS